MLIALRIISLLGGVFTAANVALGLMPNPVFVLPDYILAAALVIAALIPARALAVRALLAANAFAAGVFTVAMTGHVMGGGAFNAGLTAGLILTLIAAAFLLVRPSTAV
jgi:hypothetical protein